MEQLHLSLKDLYPCTYKSLHYYIQALWAGGSVSTSVRGPEIQEGARESLEGQ